MAPDLNSVPSSPHHLSPAQGSSSSSRRVSHSMGPPPVPPLGGPHEASSAPLSALSGTAILHGEAGGFSGPGPIRHPRPLTAAELHLELEKEQEAVVNRLTRELSLLRQQTASAVSNASSTSTGIAAEGEHGPHIISGPTASTSSRRHRSSSNLSSQSLTLSGINSATVSGIAPARDAAASASTHIRGPTPRHDSGSTSRRPDLAPPSQSAADSQLSGPFRYGSNHGSTTVANAGALHGTSPIDIRSPMRTSSSGSSRLEEVVQQRAELDNVRRENEALRRRIQDLERQLSQRNADATGEPV